MSKSKSKSKSRTKQNIKKKTIKKRNKNCVYTDEAKRLMKIIKTYKQKNKNIKKITPLDI